MGKAFTNSPYLAVSLHGQTGLFRAWKMSAQPTQRQMKSLFLSEFLNNH